LILVAFYEAGAYCILGGLKFFNSFGSRVNEKITIHEAMRVAEPGKTFFWIVHVNVTWGIIFSIDKVEIFDDTCFTAVIIE
jgi:hypothetical protein